MRRRLTSAVHVGTSAKRPSVQQIFKRLYDTLGPQYWWPAQGPFEMMVGAILTQTANWYNVERAINRLRRGEFLTPRRLIAVPTSRLQRLIRPSGYFRQKSRRLKIFARWYLQRYQGNPRRMFGTSLGLLRKELLQLEGIGPETADSMLLYAGNQCIFVVDAYTRRIFERHGLIGPGWRYTDIQQLVMASLPTEAQGYNEFHALLVAIGKRFCHRGTPDCTHCPLGDLPRTLEVSTDGKG